MRKKLGLFAILLLLLGAIIVSRRLGQYVSANRTENVKEIKNLVVIDAGHGGYELRQNR